MQRVRRNLILAAGIVSAIVIFGLIVYRISVVAHVRAEAQSTSEVLKTRLDAISKDSETGLSSGQRYMRASYSRGIDHLGSSRAEDLIVPFPMDALLQNREGKVHPTLGVEWLERGFAVKGLYFQDKHGNSISFAPNLFHWTDDEKKWFRKTMRRDHGVEISFDGENHVPEPDSYGFPKLSLHCSLNSAIKNGLRVGLISTYGRSDLIDVFLDPSVLPSATTTLSPKSGGE
jgi:hypothetical protein